MKAYILAAGEGTRMRPLTANKPKPLLPVAGKPFLEHTTDVLVKCGISEATILMGWQGKRIREYFGDGKGFGLKLDYEEQEQRLGTAHAVGLAKSHVRGDFLSINGDIVLTASSLKALLEFYRKKKGTVMAVADVPTPASFGVVEMKGDKVVSIEEKPSKPKSNLINAGVYVLGTEIFDFIERTPKSKRGEFEITDSLRLMMEKEDLFGYKLPGEWIDVGRPWDLLRANEVLLRNLRTSVKGEVHRSASLQGSVVVEDGAEVLSGAFIEGPTIIGRKSIIGPNCYIRSSTSVGENCRIGNACEVKNSIIMEDTHIPHQNYVGDSVIGERCNLGAGTKIANLRLDEANIHLSWRGQDVDTGLRKLGVIMGDDVKVGINASIDVGAIIGEGSFIGPCAYVRGVIAPHTKVF